MNLVASKSNLFKASTIGWILKYSESRLIQVRALSYNIILLILNERVLSHYQSIINQTLNVIYSPNESYCVIVLAMKVLSKAISILEE